MPPVTEIKPVTGEQLGEFFRTSRRVFGFDPPSDQELELFRPAVELDRTLAVFEGASIVATGVSIPFQLTVPGGALPMAGVATVTVLPTHRRRGLLRALMRRQLNDVRERHEPLAGLYASEAPIYGRFGYGPATHHASLEVQSQVPFAQPLEAPGTLRLVDREEAERIFPAVWDAARPGQPGMVSLSRERWRLKLADLPSMRQGGTEQYRAVYEEGGQAHGYALYRLHREMTDVRLGLVDLIVTTPAAYAALWRYLLDVDLVKRVTAASRPVEEPLAFLLADRRALKLRHPEWVFESLWLCLVDVPAALAGRRYAGEDALVLEVLDQFTPAHSGRYRLEGSPAGAACERTQAAPDLVLDAADLAAAYLGGNRFSTLHRAGRVEERTAGALLRADALFASDPPPWCPYFF